jgi:hypothetical protein
MNAFKFSLTFMLLAGLALAVGSCSKKADPNTLPSSVFVSSSGSVRPMIRPGRRVSSNWPST